MRKSLIAMSVVFVMCLAFAAHGSVNVFDDAVFWFRGGKDKNGDGYMQQGEFFDDLHANSNAHPNHQMPIMGFSQNAELRTEQVVFPALGTSVPKSMQVLHIGNKRADIGGEFKYHPIAVVPHAVFSENNISNEYTIASRIRLDNLKNMESLFRIGYDADSKKGMVLGLAQHSTVTNCKYITGFCTAKSGSSNKQFKLEQLLVPTNTWVDVAVVVGNGKLRVGVAIPESLASPNPNATNTIAFAETQMWTANCPLLDDSYYRLFHLNGQDNPEASGSAAAEKYYFLGSVQQLAIWGRALSDQEVMAAFGMPRPAIFRTGFDNGSSNEFCGERSGSSQTIDGLGSWQNIANTMQAGDTWTVNFDALRDEANLPQIFSIKSLRGSAALIEPKLNGTSLGEGRVASNQRFFWPVAANLVREGANTLVIERKDNWSGTFKLDAMELGGALGVGSASDTYDDGRVFPELIATGVPSAAGPNLAHWPVGFRPFLNNNTNLHFRVWVDPDVVGVCTSRFWTRVQCKKRTSSSTVTGQEKFTIFVNGEARTTFNANASWKDVDPITFDPGVLRGGWNDFEIRSNEAYTTLYWVFDRYRFETVLPSPFGFPMPPGMSIILK